ncbi:MAG: RagB/SusD family nutrient uptake outer membrane protein, partial [Bacteroidales bacterium]|nr:RagB/SusD family nutrient uptake outer membrane protein [Bacteroidales bacterium]
MKKIIYIFILIIFTISCEYTNIEPIGKTQPNNIDALKGLINHQWANGGVEIPMYMTQDILVKQNIMLDKYFGIGHLDYAYNFRDYFFEITESSRNLNSVSSELNRMNIILENIDEISLQEEGYGFVKQTALIRRAHIYYLFLNIYCTQYTSDNANTPKLGWINKYTEDYDSDMTRLTLQESYNLVIKDLKEALKINMPRQKYSTYGSTDAANGLLAMVYMAMGNYKEALKYCNLSLNRYSFLYDYSSLDTAEIIDQNSVDLVHDKEKIMARGAYVYLEKYPKDNKAYCSSDFISLFTEKDMRRHFLFPSGTDTLWYGARNCFFDAGCSVPLLMLYKAECLARAGQVGDAMEVLNSLRQRRFVSGSNYELTASEVGD